MRHPVTVFHVRNTAVYADAPGYLVGEQFFNRFIDAFHYACQIAGWAEGA